MEGVQHLHARRVIELYLLTRGRVVSDHNMVNFRTKFVEEHKLEKRFHGHSYDIVTQEEIIEIDDLNSHPKKAHKINDGLAERYIKEYHPEYKFYRLLKEEICDRQGRLLDPKDVAQYLRENLF
jgi:hypothetical protein